MDDTSIQTTTLAQQIEPAQSTPISFGAILVASLAISLFVVIGYLLIKWFKL